MTYHVVTANRLRDGEVVYYTKDGQWSEDLVESAVVEGKEQAEALLEKTLAVEEELRVVGPYLAIVDVEDNQAVALGQRETIRAVGPTVHPHFGKQAQGK